MRTRIVFGHVHANHRRPGFVVESKGVEEENSCVSNDLICSIQEERKIKNKMCGQQAKAQWRTNVLSE